jgi:hypothetical protein
MKLHFLLLGLLLTPAISRATSFHIAPMSEFVQSSPNIVRGIVRSIRPEEGTDTEGNRVIRTYAEVEITEVLKGRIQEKRILIRKSGGSTNGMNVEIAGAPEFHENEDTVLFLGDLLEDRSYEIEGLELGKFEIEKKNGKEMLSGGLLAYSEGPAEGAQGPGIEANRRDWSIGDLKKLVATPEPPPAAGATEPRPGATAPALPGSAEPLPTGASVEPPGESSKEPEETGQKPEDSPSRTSVILFGLGIGIALAMLFRSKK